VRNVCTLPPAYTDSCSSRGRWGNFGGGRLSSAGPLAQGRSSPPPPRLAQPRSRYVFSRQCGVRAFVQKKGKPHSSVTLTFLHHEWHRAGEHQSADGGGSRPRHRCDNRPRGWRRSQHVGSRRRRRLGAPVLLRFLPLPSLSEPARLTSTLEVPWLAAGRRAS